MHGKYNNFSSLRRQEELDTRAKPTPHLCVMHRKGSHFCETCQRVKPANKYKAVKGWKCTDCLTINGVTQNEEVLDSCTSIGLRPVPSGVR